jgi:hypothetical protein
MLSIEESAIHRVGTEGFDQQSALVTWFHVSDGITIAPGA